MKRLLMSFWQRGWCRALLWAAIAFGLACLHPFVRQSIFGPTIEGIPWCVWESRVRETANIDQPKSWLYQIREKIGLVQTDDTWNFDSEEALPLYLRLAEDRDPCVRVFAMSHLRGADDAVIIALMKRHLTDEEPRCRLSAAAVLWRASKDAGLRQIIVPLLDHADYDVRVGAIRVFGEMCREMPENFDRLAKLAEHPDVGTRVNAIIAIEAFGKRAIPILRKGLRDKNTCRFTVVGAGRMRQDAAELIPDLLALRNDADADVRTAVEAALPLIDPDRFPPAAEVP
jgi:hypothetical protein